MGFIHNYSKIIKQSLQERFDDNYIVSPNGCWLWTGSVYPNGYGRLTVKNRSKLAHRLSVELHKGQIPIGMFVCHKCDIKNCVSPHHLFVGTAKDNSIDLASKGLNPRQKITHCPKGHEYTKENIMIRTKKHGLARDCKECNRLRAAYNRKMKTIELWEC